MLARNRCRSVAAPFKHFGVGARGHHPTTARRSDAVYDLPGASGSYRSSSTPQTIRPPGPPGGPGGSVAILKTFLFLRRIANRCYRRVVSCFRCCLFFPSVGMVWIWMVVFFLPCAQEGTPETPDGGGRIFCEGDHSRFVWEERGFVFDGAQYTKISSSPSKWKCFVKYYLVSQSLAVFSITGYSPFPGA